MQIKPKTSSEAQRMQEQNANQTQITRIEEFINEVLKEDLRQLEKCIGQFNEEIMEYVQLKNTLQTFDTHLPEGYKTQVNIGSNIFMQARVRKMDSILVNVGKDVYLEMSIPEAERFSDTRVKILTKQSDVLREESVKKRAQIKMALIAISERAKLIQDV
ncbi:protein UXT homolog [Drosophila subpulchrella]|uniref:protein UXT homolog n=1 Tax=Drosophila subpulchrella TaxID=1486046 RepID=UPI0018A17B81|nr:protein UXT homolog [Drosophila subpulchrella]XP_037708909.1 protein UXT homolog [Drosophila subpulchrella]